MGWGGIHSWTSGLGLTQGEEYGVLDKSKIVRATWKKAKACLPLLKRFLPARPLTLRSNTRPSLPTCAIRPPPHTEHQLISSTSVQPPYLPVPSCTNPSPVAACAVCPPPHTAHQRAQDTAQRTGGCTHQQGRELGPHWEVEQGEREGCPSLWPHCLL